MAILHVPVTDTLAVYRITGDDPHLLIERREGGLVRIEAGEVERLVDVLTLLAGDLREPEDPLGDLPEWANGTPWED